MRKRYFAGFVILAALAACAGGGGGGTAIAPSSTVSSAPSSLPSSASTTGASTATFTITIPKSSTSSLRRSPAYIAANTQSITLTLLQSNGVPVAGTPQGPFPLVAGSPGCATGANGVTCSVTVNAPIGNDIFVAQTYTTTTAAAGSLLGSGAVSMTVADNARNTAIIALNGPVAHFNVFAATPTLTAPGPATSRIFVIALDAQNNVIVNPAMYDTPIVLSLDFTNYYVANSISLSATYAYGQPAASINSASAGLNVYSPSDIVTFSWNAPVNSGSGVVRILASLNGAMQSATSVAIVNSPPAPTPTPNVTPPPTSPPTSPPTLPPPTPTPPGLTFMNSNNYPGFTGGTFTGNSNVSSFEFATPAPSGPTPAPVSFSLVEYPASFSGPITFTTTGCGGVIAPAPTSPVMYTMAPVTVAFSEVSTTSSSGCMITASDGSNSATLNVYVNDVNLTVQGRRRTH